MKVFIIGAGNVGTAMAIAAVTAKNEVSIFSTSVEKTQAAAEKSGAKIVGSVAEGVKNAELVYLAVPGSVVASLALELKPIIAGKVVIDGTNPLNESYTDLTYKGQSAAADLQDLLPGISVVKAFNTLFAGRYATPSQKGTKLQIFIAGEDSEAKALVGKYAESMGFDAVDIGGLRYAKSMEEMAFLNISLNASKSLSWQSAWSLSGPEKLA